VSEDAGRDAAEIVPKGAASVSPRPASQKQVVSMRNRSGIWEVRVDGRFYGDYLRRELADESMRQAARPPTGMAEDTPRTAAIKAPRMKQR
jgi:hypothetical protein